MEGPIPWSVLVACVIAVYMVLSACDAQPQRKDTLLTDGYHPSRSLAFDDPAQRVLEDRGQQPQNTLPWFAARNDQPKSVVSGYESPRLVESVTWRYDSQRLINGRAFDHVHETTWTREYREQVR